MYALLAIQLAQLALEEEILSASLALFLSTIKQQQINAWALVILGSMELQLQFLFVQPVSRRVLLVLEVLPQIVYLALALCISILGQLLVSLLALQLPSRIPAIMSALHVRALAQLAQELAPLSAWLVQYLCIFNLPQTPVSAHVTWINISWQLQLLFVLLATPPVLLVLVLLQLSVYHAAGVYFILAPQKLAVQLVQAINTKTLLTMSALIVILAV